MSRLGHQRADAEHLRLSRPRSDVRHRDAFSFTAITIDICVACMRAMPPVTIYLSGDLIDAARREARGRNRSLSAWIGGLVQDAVVSDWPQSFVDLLHQGAGDLVEPDDPPPEDIKPLPE